ncbi:glucose-1-phosphate thymidylyltransferase RfbA [Metabacillus halosaccharovorans]|uniref:glucose-1-phosphate thymidylyltransferase RfbA n=1 Tax=Metabacillus halosaccharovorans TaxID=930124 RepID=UPI000C8031B4|nr:glucose-1-phosphate thymidylyltransferase [Bacillus sp. UMB0899]
MKGIIIAGGNGTRLSPLTKVISKALLPVYDKPMIYYPLSILMEANIREILIITTPQDKERYIDLLGDGKQLGISIKYEIETKPLGIAQAFIIGEKFIGDEGVTLILGDNIFYGNDFSAIMSRSINRKEGATIFGYHVNDPERFGVVEFNKDGKVISIEEKPKKPKTNYAVTGLYIYDNKVVEIAKKMKPSERGELEITDINKKYLDMGNLHVELLGDEFTWFDTGTHHSLYQTTKYIEETEREHSIKIGCIEEIAYEKGYISKEQLVSLAQSLLKSGYGTHLVQTSKFK